MRKYHGVHIVTDCDGQAISRMTSAYWALFGGINVCHTVTTSRSGLEAGGNIVDIMYASRGVPMMFACNNAPRVLDKDHNGSAIVFGKVGPHLMATTVHTVGLVAKANPRLSLRRLNTDAFIEQHIRYGRPRPNFRGLWVIPDLLKAMATGTDLDDVSTPVDRYPVVEPTVWLIDDIEGKPTNVKLTYQEDELDCYQPGCTVTLVAGDRTVEVKCYERLTDIPVGQLGLYASSSGYNGVHFLELGIMDGSAASFLHAEIGMRIQISG